MNRPLLLILAGLLAGCPTASDDDDAGGPDLDALANARADLLLQWLVGDFNSEQQSIDDPQYYPIRVLGCPVLAPELGERAIYIEQAFLDDVANPYRQRVYTVQASNEDEVSAWTTVYALTDASSAVGLCDTDDQPEFGEDDVELREGCGVNVEWSESDRQFVGGTDVGTCSSTINGATYATSDVVIEATQFTSWDRGFDANDDQVWGATDGAYIFERQ